MDGCHTGSLQIRRNLEVDLNDVSRRIDSTVRCMIVVHYFGFPQRELRGDQRVLRQTGIALDRGLRALFLWHRRRKTDR